MGKGELWDDSALINAFDLAISNYKKMHGKGCKQVHSDVNTNNNETTSVFAVDDNQCNQSRMETVGGQDDTSHVIVKEGELQKIGTAEGNEGVNSQVSEKEHVLGLDTLPFQGQSHQTQNHSSSVVVDEYNQLAVDEYNQLAVDEYNQLYKEYYEVEEQRQKILERLQQFSSSTYTNTGEASVSSLQWGTNYTNQAYQSSTSQVPCGCVVVSCCSCSCPYSAASCSSLSCVPTNACAGNHSTDASEAKVREKKPEDVDIINMAMGAAERAISSFKDKTNGFKEENKACSEMEQSCSSETDLSVVLNAWFSAGFHTGKYLTEQSLAKKQPN